MKNDWHFCQLGQAVDFQDKNQSAVVEARTAVMSAANRFLDEKAEELIPGGTIADLRTALSGMNIVQFARMIRPFAAKFVGAGLSDRFWAMIDSSDFYWDATGAEWPYMTMAKRSQSLTWAADTASKV